MSNIVQLVILGAIWGGSFLFFHEKLAARQCIALVMGFTGIIVLASGRMAGMSVGWASIAGGLASLLYGLGIHMARRHLQGLPSAALGALCTGVAFAVFYRLIGRIGASRTSIVTYLIPPFGVAWGWLFLREPVTATMVIACGLILGSVALSQDWGARR